MGKGISLADRIRGKLSWHYQRDYIYSFSALKGWGMLKFYRLIYPNFTVGDDASIWGGFQVMMYDPTHSRIEIGRNLHMVSDARRSGIALFSQCKFTTMGQGNITLGDNVGLNGVAITSTKRIEIGEGTIIAPNCIIVDSDFHAPWPPNKRFSLDISASSREVVIGKNVWLGLNVTVLKGSTIGDNSIVGAGSVVTGAIPSNVVAAGVPAKIIKPLGPSDN